VFETSGLADYAQSLRTYYELSRDEYRDELSSDDCKRDKVIGPVCCAVYANPVEHVKHVHRAARTTQRRSEYRFDHAVVNSGVFACT
jgi:hypothetical protein